MFIGRKEELNFLEDRYNSADGQLVVLYGRRRVGKTELLRQFCQDKEHIFYTCTEIIDEKQLEAFSQRLLEKITRRQNILLTSVIGSRPCSVYRSWQKRKK